MVAPCVMSALFQSLHQLKDEAGNPFVGGLTAKCERQLVGLQPVFDPEPGEPFRGFAVLKQRGLEFPGA